MSTPRCWTVAFFLLLMALIVPIKVAVERSTVECAGQSTTVAASTAPDRSQRSQDLISIRIEVAAARAGVSEK